jgi:dolichol kinase
VAVFVPGLIYQCTFLFVASVVILSILILLETARLIKLFPVHNILEVAVSSFIDEKDAGNVALTPIYLLIGCACPLWIHNSPCDLTDSAGFEMLPLLAGILSIGIGDTFAGVIGSKCGKHKWPNSQKSVEGTLASILAQNLFIGILYALNFISLNVKVSAICEFAIIANALVEARTDQVDNLVLPLVTYVILLYK